MDNFPVWLDLLFHEHTGAKGWIFSAQKKRLEGMRKEKGMRLFAACEELLGTSGFGAIGIPLYQFLQPLAARSLLVGIIQGNTLFQHRGLHF